MKFTADVQRFNGPTTGVVVPWNVVEEIGRGRRTKVRIVLNGYVYLGSFALLGGEYRLAISAPIRTAAGVATGDRVEVELSPCDSPHDVFVPADLAAALDRYPIARRAFDRLDDGARLRQVLEIEEAATERVRSRRIDRAVATLRDSA